MIRLKNISRSYKMGSVHVHALKNIDLEIRPGEFVAIMGPSGSGKSTLLHVLGFLDRPDEGSYLLNGMETTGLDDNRLASMRNSVAGFVFQQFHLLARTTARDNVELGLVYSGPRATG